MKAFNTLKTFSTCAHKALSQPKNAICNGCTKMSFPLRFICGDLCYFRDPAIHLKKISYFQLFEIPPSFQIDASKLDMQFRSLQMQYHPDRMPEAGSDANSARYNASYSVYINEAYKTLKSDLGRALYLLKLQGIEPLKESEQTDGGEFLEAMLELHETIDSSAGNKRELMRIKNDIESKKQDILNELTTVFATKGFAVAPGLVIKLKYVTAAEEMISKLEYHILRDQGYSATHQ